MNTNWIPSFVSQENNSFMIDWVEILQAFPVLRELEQVPQDAAFHAEGDVLTHTKMVVEHLTSRSEWQQLDPVSGAEVWLAALLHDIGKLRMTEIRSDGSVRSPGHTFVGESMARILLWAHPGVHIPFANRERIVRYIRYHGLPLWFLEKAKPKRSVIIPSQMISMQHLYLVSLSDVYGRICTDRQNLINTVELFRSYCEELGCFIQPYPFTDSYSRFLYTRKDDRESDYPAYDDTKNTVILMSGLPGSGKDTWIQKNAPGVGVISLDAIRRQLGISPEDNQGIIVQTAKEQGRELLRDSVPFVWNATNITRKMRQPLVDLFYRYNAGTKLVYVECDYDELFSRNNERENIVPERVLNKLVQKLEVPDITEAQEVVYELE